MEVINFFTVVSVIVIALGFGAGIMIWAYRGSGSQDVLFTDAVLMSPALKKSKVASSFHQGYDAFQAGQYQLAIASFNEVIQAIPDCPEAYHNRGLVLANLLKDNQAVKDLARAAELYANDDNSAAITVIRSQLQQLNAR